MLWNVCFEEKGKEWKSRMGIGNVIKEMLEILNKKYPLREQSAGEYALLKIKGMNFTIQRYLAEGLGNVSVMRASGYWGLMKMDTLIINPTELDLPLFSYDRVMAVGKDTLIIELYDTLLGDSNLGGLQKLKEDYKALPEHDLGTHWYDSIKLTESVAKKGKKAQFDSFCKLALKYLEVYLTCAGKPELQMQETERTKKVPTTEESAFVSCDAKAKREKASVYVEGLLTNGGPSTDIFKKALGEEKTAYLFHKILFGTGER